MFQLFCCLLLVFVVSTSSFGAEEPISIAADCSNASNISGTTISKIENFYSALIESQSRSSSFNPNLENFMSAVEMIIRRGYHVEMHPITTKDDYIIMLHRIPYLKGRTSGPTGRSILIFPGFIGGTEGFVLTPSEDALADLGYDVWVINYRGTTSSRGHVNLDSNHDKTYWQFSYDEMGRYDCPAGINYVLNVTGRENLTLISYSLGTTVFFTCMHYHPELNDKVDKMLGMAPEGTLAYTKSILIRLTAAFLNPLMVFLWPFVDGVFLSKNDSPFSFAQRFCLKNPSLTLFCNNAAFLLVGADYGNMNQNVMIALANHLLTGSSVRTFIHQILQNVVLDWNLRPTFNKFNYGWIGNWKRYGTINPPAYDLSKVTAPVYIIHGENDYFATPKNVEWVASRLPNVKQTYLVDNPKFNHIDFLFHRNVKELVYDQLIAILSQP